MAAVKETKTMKDECSVGHNTTPSRIIAIDALRGLVMLIMLVDHVRDVFFSHQPAPGPMDVATVGALLFFMRTVSHVCAPVFIFLSGVAAYGYCQKRAGDKQALSKYLFSRGVFLMCLEITVVNFAWTGSVPPPMFYLQVIWVIGASMALMSLVVWLPMPVIAGLGFLVVTGHDLLAPISFEPESPWYMPWALLHQRSVVELTETVRFRTSYPLLPWVGIMALGYVFGRWYQHDRQRIRQRGVMLYAGIGMIVLFVVLRGANVYGDPEPWRNMATPAQTFMSFLNLTKYPASLLFVLSTLGVGAVLLWICERNEIQNPVWMRVLLVFGKTALFFYVAHLYLLGVCYVGAHLLIGPNQGGRFGFNHPASNVVLAVTLALPLYVACKRYLQFKRRHDYWWLAYF